MSVEGVAFEFRADAWVLMGGLVVGYLWALRNLGPRLATGMDRRNERNQRRRFVAGLAARRRACTLAQLEQLLLL